MRVRLVAVGSELLVGDIVDTNSAWLARTLAEVGAEVTGVAVVGDAIEEIAAQLRAAIANADVVIVTGGLGPTSDDVTRHAVARVADVPLVRRDELVAHLRSFFAGRGRGMPDSNLIQADVPAGADVVPPVGTAAGFALDIAGSLVVCLPGVPSELEAMVPESVLGLLQLRGGLTATVTRTVRTAGIAESEVAERCADVVASAERSGGPIIAFLASGGQTRVKVTTRAADPVAARAAVDPVVEQIVDRLGTAVVGVDDEDLEHAVARLLGARGWTLATAESITGGGVAARLVTVPGASAWFAGALVTYATLSKTLLAAVPHEVLADHGPVSEPTAIALARAARDQLQTDVGLGIVGVAGPETQGGRPVGTVCVAVVMPDGKAARTIDLPPRSRVELQRFAATAALEFLRRRLAGRPGE